MRTVYKLGLIGALYASEGLPFGFFTQALPVLLRQSGLSLTEIGLSSILALPWALKFMWAPMVDGNYSRKFGRRKSWIVPVQICTSAMLLWAATLSPKTDLRFIFAAVALSNLFAATLDIATDALAVRLLEPHERGWGNGVQVGGYRVGMVISGGLLLIVFEWLGWAGSFLVMSGLILLLTLPILFYREPPPEEAAPRGDAWSWSYFRERGVITWLLVILFYKFGDAFGAGMVKPFLIDGGMSLADVGWIIGTVGFAASLCGALAGGALASRIGYYRAMIASGMLQVAGIAGYWLLAVMPAGKPLYFGVITFEHLAGGMATASLFTMMMDGCRPGSEGMDYTVQSCVFVAASGGAAIASGFVADRLGYPSYFALSCVTAFCAIVPMMVAFRAGGFRALKLNRAAQAA